MKVCFIIFVFLFLTLCLLFVAFGVLYVFLARLIFTNQAQITPEKGKDKTTLEIKKKSQKIALHKFT